MGGNSKTAMLLKECMADALIRLLAKKSIEKITVQEITDLAGVGRATYFRHCTTKEELIAFKLICLSERWREERENDDQSVHNGDQIYEFFSFCTTIQRLLLLIYRRNIQLSVFDSFVSSLILPEQKNRRAVYRARYCAYGVLGMLEEWVKHDFQETPEELAEMIQRD